MDTSIDLKRLRHLSLLAEELNFSRAAERAHLSQAAFSRSIQGLEEDFGLRLFDRGTRSVRVTAAGQQVLAHARALLGAARSLAHEVHGLAHVEGGHLSFGASLLAVSAVLPGVLPALQRKSPGLSLNVEVSQWEILLQHLQQERIEFFVGHPGPLAADPRFEVTALNSHPCSLFAGQNHPLARSTGPLSVEQLTAYPWAAVQMNQALRARVASLLGLPGGQAVPLAMVCDNLTLLRETTLATQQLLLTWRHWLQDDLDQGRMQDLGVRLQSTWPASEMQLECAMVRIAGQTPSPAAQRLMGLLLEGVGATR